MTILSARDLAKRGILPTGQTPDAGSDYDPRFFADVVPAAFRLENTVVSAFSGRNATSDIPADPDFDPLASIPDGHEEFARRYAFANSPRDVQELRAQIDKELVDRQMLASAPVGGFVAALAAGAIDPVNLIPVGGVAYKTYRTGGSILQGAATTARAGFMASTAAELALHASQDTRTTTESAFNITAGTFLSGILGGGASAVNARLAARGLTKSLDEIEAQVAADLTVDAPGSGSVSAAASRGLPQDLVDQIEVQVREQVTEGRIAPERAQTEISRLIKERELEFEGIKTNLAVKAVLKTPLGRQDPILRSLQSESVETRRLVQELAEIPIQLNKASFGEAPPVSVQRSIANHSAPLYRSLKQMDDLYVQYVDGRSKRFGDIAKIAGKRLVKADGVDRKITLSEFRHRVGKAMRRNEEDPIPEVAQAAKVFREEVFEPLKKRAIDEKLLDEDVDVKTADSFLNRVYNKELLSSDEGAQKFINIVTDWLEQRQIEAEARIRNFDAEQKPLREDVKQLRRELKAVQDATFNATQRAVREEIQVRVDKAFDEMAERIERDIESGKADDKTAKAQKAAAKRFFKEFQKSIEDDVELEVRAVADEVADETLGDILVRARADEDIDLVAALRDELPPSPAEAGGRAGADAAISAVSRAADDAAIAAEKSFKRSLQAQDKRIEKLLDDPDARKSAAQSAARAEINKSVAKEARKAATVASREATTELRAKLKEAADKLEKRRKQQRRDVAGVGRERQELLDTAQQIKDRILGTPAGRLDYDDILSPSAGNRNALGGVRRGSLAQRRFLIPDELIEEFLESDIELVAKRYVNSIARDVEVFSRFGSLDMKSQFDDVRRFWAQKAQDAGEKAESPDTKNTLSKIRDKVTRNKTFKQKLDDDLRDLDAMRQQLLGLYGLPDNPMAITPRVLRGVRQFNMIRLLGSMTISAIPDVGRPVMVNGIGRVYGSALKPLVTDFQTFKLASREIRDLGGAADMLLNSRMQILGDIGDEFNVGSKIERGLQGLQDTFGMVSLMAPWNTFFKQLSGITAQSRILRAIHDEAAGKIAPKEQAFLRSTGIGKDDARLILEQFRAHGGKEDDVFLSGAMDWDDGRLRTLFQSAINREIERTIVTPGLDSPLVARRNDTGRLLFQFKSFAFASTQRTLISGLQQADMATLNGAMISFAAGYLVYVLKQWDAGREISGDLDQSILEAVDRSGLLTIPFEANNILEKVTRGSVGASALIGGQPLSRYTSRNTVGALMGPSFEALSTAAQVAGNTTAAAFSSEDEFRASDVHAMRRLLPYQNLFLFRQVLSAAERGIANTFGLE